MASSTSSNSARRNGKKWKSNPGVSSHAATGRTVKGYSPAAVERRAARRSSAPAATTTRYVGEAVVTGVFA